MQDIGPDILADISNQTLQDMGMNIGEIIQLKQGSALWWIGPDTKRKCSDSDTLAKSQLNHTPDSPNVKKIAYKRHYHDGGRAHFGAGPMWSDGDDNGGPHEYDISTIAMSMHNGFRSQMGLA
jgi:hypothetical protein